MLYVSEMIPASNKGRFFAFVHVFSGKVAADLKVRTMGPNYLTRPSLARRRICMLSVQRTVIWMGKKLVSWGCSLW